MKEIYTAPTLEVDELVDVADPPGPFRHDRGLERRISVPRRPMSTGPLVVDTVFLDFPLRELPDPCRRLLMAHGTTKRIDESATRPPGTTSPSPASARTMYWLVTHRCWRIMTVKMITIKR